MAATNKELEREVAKGTFRSDLYYRLKVAGAQYSPAFTAGGYLAAGAEFFDLYGKKYRKSVNLSDEAKQVLQNHTWPGNVRELENLVRALWLRANTGLWACAIWRAFAHCRRAKQARGSTPCLPLKAGRSKAS